MPDKEKLVHLNILGHATTFKISEEVWKKFTSIAHSQYGHGGVKKIFDDFSLNFIQKYDGKQSGKIDKFFDPNYTPKPEIDGDMEHNIIPWLRVMTTEQLAKQQQISYQTYVWSRALHSTPPGDRLIVDFDLTTLWKKFR